MGSRNTESRFDGGGAEPAEALQREHDGGGAGLGVELGEEVLDVFADGLGGDAEDGGDLGVAFAVGEPARHLAFAGREADGAERGEVAGGRCPG